MLEDHVFGLSLEPNVPVPVAPGVELGASVKTDWHFQNAQGLVKKGLNDKGEHVFFPLYSLKRINWGKVSSVTREAEEEKDAETLWVSSNLLAFALLISHCHSVLDARTPWDDLDDDGNEIEIPLDSDDF